MTAQKFPSLQLAGRPSTQTETEGQTQPHSTIQAPSRSPALTSGSTLEKLPKDDNRVEGRLRSMSHKREDTVNWDNPLQRRSPEEQLRVRDDDSHRKLNQTCPGWLPREKRQSRGLSLGTFQQMPGLPRGTYADEQLRCFLTQSGVQMQRTARRESGPRSYRLL